MGEYKGEEMENNEILTHCGEKAIECLKQIKQKIQYKHFYFINTEILSNCETARNVDSSHLQETDLKGLCDFNCMHALLS